VDREGFSRIGKRNRTFTGRVEDIEEIHSSSDHADFGLVVFEPKGEACPEESEAEEREGEEEEVATAPDVDCEEGRDGEDPVEDACAHGREKGGVGRIARFGEDCGAVVGYYVDLVGSVSERT